MDDRSHLGTSAAGSRPSAARELADRLAAERAGRPFLVLTDGGGLQRLLALDAGLPQLTIGRAAGADLVLDWDEEVSRVHAVMEQVAGDWTIADDGLSYNGTFVNEERIQGRRRLRDGDRIRAGSTTITFRLRRAEASAPTRRAQDVPARPALSPAQRRVLVALCRPYKDGGSFAVPAGNQEIAQELVLSVDAVKTHMRALFEKLGVGDLPANQKRVRLVERAFLAGLVSERDL